MATIITNRATVNYNSGSVNAVAFSNTTSAVLNGSLNIVKTSLSNNYRVGQELTYIIRITNNGNTPTQNIQITDNLGTFAEGLINITPLSYIGIAQLFINGVFVSDIEALVNPDSVIFNIESIPAGGTVQILYRATVNEYACQTAGATITNTVCAACNCSCEETVCNSFTLEIEEYADLRVVKSVCPNPIICGELTTYTIEITNYGNIDANNIVITDTFSPALENITVKINDVIIPPDRYSYVDGLLTISAATGSDINIPAASCVRDAETGIVEIIPEKVTISVSGNV